MINERSEPIRILLIMDEVVVRTGLSLLLQAWSEIEIVGETGRGPEALSMVSRDQPDIALLDMGADGGYADFGFLSDLVNTLNNGRVIILADESNSAVHLKAVELGAMGVVYKEKAVEDLRKALSKVNAGEVWLDRLSTGRLVSYLTREDDKKPDPDQVKIASLTDRERQIATLVCQGLQNDEIGRRLFISETTVRHHLTSIFSKLEAKNRLELIIFLYRNKFAAPLP